MWSVAFAVGMIQEPDVSGIEQLDGLALAPYALLWSIAKRKIARSPGLEQ
jgi:hypothetical protein